LKGASERIWVSAAWSGAGLFWGISTTPASVMGDAVSGPGWATTGRPQAIPAMALPRPEGVIHGHLETVAFVKAIIGECVGKNANARHDGG
jgi:hypothetical protein